ncbi:MAG: T9SS type A sorting domain-containing protein [Candidatus Kapabacteria bacterium]|nr:T9SS type A sorting domain-containing protein [Candidatus Kapabacteria bacterium]
MLLQIQLGSLSMRCFLFCVFALIPTMLFADPNGKAGRTSTSTAGCGDCHGASASSSTRVTLEGGPRKVLPGSTTTFTVVVAHSSQPRAGVGIAMRTTQTGSTNIGTLAFAAGSGLRLRGAELSQSAPQTMSGGSFKFTFTWKAPSQVGTYFLQGIGNAVNGNGREDSGDSWAWMTPVAITVEAATSVEEDVAPIAMIYPNPYSSGSILHLGNELTGATRIQLIDVRGSVVFNEVLELTHGTLPVPLAGLHSGVYAILASNATMTRRGQIMIRGRSHS